MSQPSANVPPEAIGVLRTFLDAGLRHDEATMKACVTRATVESGQLRPDSGPQGVTFVLGEAQMEGERVLIPVRAVPEGGPPDAAAVMEMPCLMVREDNQWKLDLSASMDRMLGGSLEQLTSAMGKAMEGIGQAMAEGLRQAFGDGATPPEPVVEQPAPGLPAPADQPPAKPAKRRRRGKRPDSSSE